MKGNHAKEKYQSHVTRSANSTRNILSKSMRFYVTAAEIQKKIKIFFKITGKDEC